jgi:hypothetical protein
MVVGFFVLALFAALSAAMHSIQRSMAETAAAAGVQVAASGTAGGPTNAGLAQADIAAAYQPTANLLRAVMWGTTVQQGCPSSAGAAGAGNIDVCVFRDPANANLIAERVVGQPAMLVPLLPWNWSVDAQVEMRQVTYQP